MPPGYKTIPKVCEVCSTTEVEKFSDFIYNICKECKKDKSAKTYLCKYCGETESENFEKGRYTNCKKCRSNNKNFKKIVEDKEINPLDKNINNHIDKYFLLNYSTFGGLSPKQIIDNHNLDLKEKDIIILI